MAYGSIRLGAAALAYLWMASAASADPIALGGSLAPTALRPLGADTSPAVVAVVDLSEQTMRVSLDGRRVGVWPISSGKAGNDTPHGLFGPTFLSPRHRSSLYDDAPMPWSVFFNGNVAVHGTTKLRKLGRPDSHGCVRLHPDNAETFFRLVKQVGLGSVAIEVRE